MRLGSDVRAVVVETFWLWVRFSRIKIHVVKMNALFVRIIEIRLPSRYFETGWVPHCINGKSVMRMKEGVDLRR